MDQYNKELITPEMIQQVEAQKKRMIDKGKKATDAMLQ
jgi:hypothetical protein